MERQHLPAPPSQREEQGQGSPETNHGALNKAGNKTGNKREDNGDDFGDSKAGYGGESEDIGDDLGDFQQARTKAGDEGDGTDNWGGT